MYGRKILLIAILLVLVLTGCSGSVQSSYSLDAVQEIISKKTAYKGHPLNNVDKQIEDEFLFNNRCFSFFRDMDYFLSFSARYDFLGQILQEYNTQAVRLIDHGDGTDKMMYFVYLTDKDTRVFVYFSEADDYLYSRGHPIIMIRSLVKDDFDDITIGDKMQDLESIDPIVTLYKQGYDSIPDEMTKKLYVDGKETISTVHLLKDGILRYDYDRLSEGNYVIKNIIFSDKFILPEMGGDINYGIYDDDYVS